MDGENEIISVRLDDGSRANQNAGETRHYGIEYAVAYHPHPSIDFSFGGTNARHRFIDYDERGVSYDDKEMNGASNWIANGGVNFRPTFISGLRVGVEWQHVGPFWMDAANTLEYEGYDIFNLRFGYKMGRTELWMNAMNIADKIHATNARKSNWGQNYNPGAPRSITAGLQVNL